MNFFLDGAIAMGLVVAALFFFRYWKETRDRLFGFFGASFLLMAFNRAALAASHESSEVTTYLYIVRLFAYLLILAAILDKNLQGDKAAKAS